MFILFLTFIVSILLSIRDICYFQYLFKSFMFINFALLCLLNDKIIQISNLGNIEYKTLSLDKSVMGALPVEICKNDEKDKDNRTCYERNEVIKLYNIKALLTIGKFYYLQTKDDIKFVLDASKIISREKQER